MFHYSEKNRFKLLFSLNFSKWHSTCYDTSNSSPPYMSWHNIMTYEHTEELYLHRNKSVAKSFYRQLKGEGFTHQQIIELSTTLLDLVTEDLRDEVETI